MINELTKEEFDKIINALGYEKPTTSREIEMRLNVSARHWRRLKDRFNESYRRRNADEYICGTRDGYVLTKDNAMIRNDTARLRRNALSMLIRVSSTKQAIALRDNYRIEFDDDGNVLK